MNHAVTGSLSSGGSHFSERANFNLFSVTKTVDAGTPKLFLFCAQGTPVPKLTVHLCRAIGEKATYMAYTFENCHVQKFVSLAERTNGQNLPMEQIAFSYAKLTLEYFKTDHASARLLGSGGKTYWDQTTNAGG